MDKKSRCTKAEKEFRTARFARMMANGATRSDLLQYAASEWGLKQRQSDEYIALATKRLEEDFNVDRQAFAAILLSQLNVVHKKGMEQANLQAVLGCINTAAKIAKLYD